MTNSPEPDESLMPRGCLSASETSRGDSGSAFAAALARGEAAKLAWIRRGELVPVQTLADRWDITRQSLWRAEQRGEVFSMMINRRRYCPREFLALDRADVSVVTMALGTLDPTEKFVFWTRCQGALCGKTLFETLSVGEHGTALMRAVRLASSWAAERNASR